LINKDAPKIGYVPSQSDKDRHYFEVGKRHLEELGFREFMYFDLDEEYNPGLLDELIACDAVFLSGGNTFYFLNNMRKRGFISVVRNFVNSGGVLIGLSAGSILMANTISLASHFDENLVGLQNLESLNLINFEFMPHLDDQPTWLENLLTYSSTEEHDIYCCYDGDGIVVSSGEIELYGNIMRVKHGKVCHVNN
jgi:dipeptidase E